MFSRYTNTVILKTEIVTRCSAHFGTKVKPFFSLPVESLCDCAELGTHAILQYVTKLFNNSGALLFSNSPPLALA